MATCNICTGGTSDARHPHDSNVCARETCDSPVPRDFDTKYIRGDVYALKESVYAAIDDIFRETFGKGSGVLIKSCKSSNKLTSTADGGRPAVIMKDQGDDPKGVLVCLATTYSGEDISNLPLIFRHFSIPVAPNHNMSHGHLDHLHGLPEWDRDNAYIIAWPIRSKATRGGIWTVKADGEEIPQLLGNDAMSFLTTESRRRREAWIEMCKDPELAAKIEAELRDHIKKRFDSGAARRASNSSFDFMATGVNAPSWRRPATIPEDPDNFILVTSGKSRGPMPWKGKHRTGSTWSFASTSTKGGADKRSIKSNKSRTSLVQDGLMNRFDILRAVRVK